MLRCWFTSVSYTHLDVYKRQEIYRLPVNEKGEVKDVH